MNPRVLVSLFPVVVFFGLTRVAPPWLAIGGGFAVSAGVFYLNRRARVVSAMAAFGFVVLAVSAVVGIFLGSEKAYLASGPVSDFLFVPVFLGSIVVGRPLVRGIAAELFPSWVGGIPSGAPVFAWLSVAWAVYDFFHGVLRVYLLRELSVGEYMIWGRLLSWPVLAVLIGATVWSVYRAAPQHGPRPDDAVAVELPAGTAVSSA